MRSPMWRACSSVTARSSAAATSAPAAPPARRPRAIHSAGKGRALRAGPAAPGGPRPTVRGANIRPGVTAVLPHAGNLFREKVPGAIFVGNGFGKLMGSTQVDELGEIETPIVLTSTLSVPRAADALLDYMLT